MTYFKISGSTQKSLAIQILDFFYPMSLFFGHVAKAMLPQNA